MDIKSAIVFLFSKINPYKVTFTDKMLLEHLLDFKNNFHKLFLTLR